MRIHPFIYPGVDRDRIVGKEQNVYSQMDGYDTIHEAPFKHNQ